MMNTNSTSQDSMKKAMIFALIAIGLALVFFQVASPALASPWAQGDILIGAQQSSHGALMVFNSSGTPKPSITTLQLGYVQTCAFDTNGDLYAVHDQLGTIVKFDHTALSPTPVAFANVNGNPRDMIFSTSGDMFVSQSGFAYHSIAKLNAQGTVVATYVMPTATTPSGPYGIDLAADQNTMYYTNFGDRISKFDLRSATPTVTTFATVTPTPTPYTAGVRVIKSGTHSRHVLVATGADIREYYDTGQPYLTYYATGQNAWYSISLDPNNSSVFWAVTNGSPSYFYKFSLDGPTPVAHYPVGVPGYGICVSPGTPTPTPTDTPTNTPTATPTVLCSSTSLWCTDLSPSGTGDNVLNGAVALAENNVLAVGGFGMTPSTQSFVEKWDGTAWSTMSPVPTIGTLNGVAATSSSDVWAVGDNGILHYDSSTWSQVSAPNGANGVAVNTTTDAWAVGNTNILHYNGAWSVSTSLPTNNALSGVAVIAPSSSDQIDVWAVGTSTSASALIMHKVNSGAWAVVSNPAPIGSTNAVLNSIDYYHSDVIWAVGSYQKGSVQQTLVEYYNYNGNGWQVVASPNPGSSFNELRHVWVDKQGDVWAVGRYLDAFSDYKTLLLHWSGGQWDQIDSPNPGVESQLVGVTSSGGGTPVISAVWAVGSYLPSLGSNYQTLIEHLIAPAAPANPADSYYERRIDTTMHYNQGHDAAINRQTGVIVLDYGQPRNFGSNATPDYGTLLIGNRGIKAKISDIEAEVENFADGYHAARQSPDTITIAVSINNDNQDGQASLTTGHGQAWAQMVMRITTYVQNRHYYEIFLNGGIDVEPNFDTAYAGTAAWIQGYLGSSVVVPTLFNFGSIENYPCQSNPPPFPNPDPPCDTWSAEKIYQASWGLGTQPLPQMYKPIFARWWNVIKRWGYDQHQGAVMYFAGDFCCSSALNASQAWRTLWLDLNSDPVTKQTPVTSVLDVINSPLP